MPQVERAQYRNDSGQIIGVVTIDRKGDEHAKALLPGEIIWLSEDERRATARAPRDPEDNPFAKGWFTRVQESRITDADDRPIDSDGAPAPEAAAPPQPPQEAAGGVEPAQGTVERPAQRRSAVKSTVGAPEEEHADHREETAATPPPQGKPIEGEYGQAEEVATPDAAKLAGREAAKRPQTTDSIKVPQTRERPSDA